ncbi:DUF2946 family protein [Metapseudomonas otitidis]|uniref:DUF2946 family protein n=1 Tax=Metapseudomonas otitidis TaxID=319939 RepID=UPI001AAFBDE9|nr:DUF2946 family protein [Pseudomonas otitidis]MBO2929798.1 DUF2946 domain-containing protein [Pseudomonas otitidis]
MNARLRRLGAHLGLLALALIVLGPLVARLQAPVQDWSWLQALACHAGGVQASPGPAPLALQPKAPEAPLLTVLDACGYCSLLLNSPAATGPLWQPLPCACPGTPVCSGQPLAALAALHFPSSRSRAPPAIA